MRRSTLVLLALLLLIVVPAGATVLSSVPVADRIPIPTTPANYFGPGPISWGNYTFSSTNASNQDGSVFAYVGGYGFSGNGRWDAGVGPMIGLNDSTDMYGVTDTITIAFTNPVNSVGDFFNYLPGGSTPTTLAVWNAEHELIESIDLSFITGTGSNLGQWIGFSESTPIAYMTMTDNYISMADPTPVVPEPGTLFLVGSGLAAMARVMRRRMC